MNLSYPHVVAAKPAGLTPEYEHGGVCTFVHVCPSRMPQTGFHRSLSLVSLSLLDTLDQNHHTLDKRP